MTSSSSPVSLAIDLPGPLAVACHDAGGANAVLAMLAQEDSSAAVRAFMTGPALAAWHSRFGDAGLFATVDEALDGAASLLSGTGWASDVEHAARIAAKARGLPSAAMLDHWVNYPPRFMRAGETVLPDQVWVTDDDALRIARRDLPGADIRLKPNHYMREQLAAVRPPGEAPVLLYLLEPARDNWGRDGAGEFQALDYFMLRQPLPGVPAGTRILLRPHPSDPPDKYDVWLAGAGPGVALDKSSTLAEALSVARWVAGCESYAMAVALEAGRTVFSTLPPWAPQCRLPQAGIVHLRAAG